MWGRFKHAVTPHSHDHTDSIQTAEESSSIGIRAAWISLAGMGATALLGEAPRPRGAGDSHRGGSYTLPGAGG